MTALKHWTLNVTIAEQDERRTSAVAVLVDDKGRILQSQATALRAPVDSYVPAVGDELAAGRALTALGWHLQAQAETDLDRSRG
ncbi:MULTISPECIES: dsRBD fold-containing protein [Catellatospora]|uniref:DUF1876 domain-containing protein n=1 Tax=Catellatospora chokoriensis TaxID=310353 RepID=A0A8J3KEW6_9ACTN|nr:MULTISPECIES: dsRBD fold-containing protein [Catellatospora]GIF94639.1 hypothetical protein Cch02nite_80830 [Catellatospora chokoriensis]